MVELDARGKSTRELNRLIKQWAEQEDEIVLLHPEARHQLGVGLLRPVRLRIEGSAGYFCAGLCDGPDVLVRNNVGWGAGDNLMSGRLVVGGSASAILGVAMRKGTIFVHGNVGSRCGTVMKGGTILCKGNAGFMAGYLMMGGRLVILGDAGDALGENMIAGEIFLGGRYRTLGRDALLTDLAPEDREWLGDLLEEYQVPMPATFQKVAVDVRALRYATREKSEEVKELKPSDLTGEGGGPSRLSLVAEPASER